MKIILLYILNVGLIASAAIPQLSRLLSNSICNSDELWICNPIWTFICAWQFSLGKGSLFYLVCYILVHVQILVYAFMFTLICTRFFNKVYCLIYVLFIFSIFVIIPIEYNSISPIVCFLYWSTW